MAMDRDLIIGEVARMVRQSRFRVAKTLDTAWEIVRVCLTEGEEVEILGFGSWTFEPRRKSSKRMTRDDLRGRRRNYKPIIRFTPAKKEKWRLQVTHNELVKAVAEATNKTQVDVAEVISALVETIKSALIEGNEARISGFGVFHAKNKPARRCVNPRSGKEMLSAPKTVVKFRASSNVLVMK